MTKEITLENKILCECDDNTEWVKYSDHLEAVAAEREAIVKLVEDIVPIPQDTAEFILNYVVEAIRERK